MFIFSWEHPVYQCLEYDVEIDKYIFERSYQKEGPEFHPTWNGAEIFINSRKMSTYLNTLTRSGLVLDLLIESEPNIALAQERDFIPEKWYSIPRAQFMPTTFIVKAHKPK